MHPIALDGKVAIVTGAGQGMGEATARLFAASGARVVVSDINKDTGTKVADKIVAGGGDATFVHCDISQGDDVQSLVGQTVERYGRLDCAVNNAAVTIDRNPVGDLDEDVFDSLMAVDLRGTFLCVKHEIRQLLKQGGGGSIVNVASICGFRPNYNSPVYSAAKAGVWSLTQSTALDYGAHGIRVNCVAPGAIITPMLETGMRDTGRDVDHYKSTVSLLGRFGAPDEVANAHLWLCSDASSYVTGTVLHVDAGYVQTPPYEVRFLH